MRSEFGQFHNDLWEWFDRLETGLQVPSEVDIWSRGFGKSTTIELATTYVGVKGSRKFALFVSGTQDQARDHVSAVAQYLELVGMERALNPYGHSRGWRKDRVRAANGFNVAAYGMDTALRGIKLADVRPDLIVIDDIDAVTDTPKIVDKKIKQLTQSILPTGSADCAVVFVQNAIHELSIANQMLSGELELLLDRTVRPVVPAVYNLEYEKYLAENGVKKYRITGGTPAWSGLPLEKLEAEINRGGLAAFLREYQHEVRGIDGYFFDVKQIEILRPDELPKDIKDWKKCRAWDLAATEGGGDLTSGKLWCKHPTAMRFGILDCRRGQWGSDRVYQEIEDAIREDKMLYGKVDCILPQDPGQAGKAQADQFRKMFGHLCKLYIKTVTGKKATRAAGQQQAINLGNVFMQEGDWNAPVLRVYRLFREDEEHEFDDDVDAGSDAYNHLVGVRSQRQVQTVRRY